MELNKEELKIEKLKIKKTHLYFSRKIGCFTTKYS
jgi:hypothetical protein